MGIKFRHADGLPVRGIVEVLVLVVDEVVKVVLSEARAGVLLETSSNGVDLVVILATVNLSFVVGATVGIRTNGRFWKSRYRKYSIRKFIESSASSPAIYRKTPRLVSSLGATPAVSVARCVIDDAAAVPVRVVSR